MTRRRGATLARVRPRRRTTARLGRPAGRRAVRPTRELRARQRAGARAHLLRAAPGPRARPEACAVDQRRSGARRRSTGEVPAAPGSRPHTWPWRRTAPTTRVIRRSVGGVGVRAYRSIRSRRRMSARSAASSARRARRDGPAELNVAGSDVAGWDMAGRLHGGEPVSERSARAGSPHEEVPGATVPGRGARGCPARRMVHWMRQTGATSRRRRHLRFTRHDFAQIKAERLF